MATHEHGAARDTAERKEKLDAFHYAKTTLEYVYQLKTEAGARAQALVTSSTLFVGALTIAATLLAGRQITFAPGVALRWMLGVPIAGGVILILSSLFLVLLVFTPVVVDPKTAREREWMAEIDEAQVLEHLRGLDAHSAAVELMREARAVSRVHILRSRLITWSVRCQMGALLCFAIALAALCYGLFHPSLWVRMGG